MSDSSRPHGLQPTRLLRPWGFPGKSTGLECHCLLQTCSLFQNSKACFTKQKKKNSTTRIKLLLLFSCQVTSDSYWLHRLHHARLPFSLRSPRICPSSCPLNRWCHPTNSSSVTLFFFYVQSFPASGSFPMSQLFTLGGQCIGASASASVLPKCIWGWFPLRLTGLISLVPKGLSRVFYSTTGWKHQFYSTLPSLLSVQLLHAYMTNGKSIALTIQTSVGQVMSLLFNILSKFVIAFFPRSKA